MRGPEGHTGRRCARAAGLVIGLAALLGGCSNGDLGPADSYRLLVPVDPQPAGTPVPVVQDFDLADPAALAVGGLLADGFASEMVRTVYLAKQLVRAGGHYPESVRAAAAQPLCLVVGGEGEGAQRHGLAFTRALRGPDARLDIAWIGLPKPAGIEADHALVQTLSGRLAAHAADWIARGAPATGSPPPLVEAYRMAMEVIAREWRVGRGPNGALPSTAGSEAQRTVFASVRENLAVLNDDTHELRPAQELVSDPRVAAVVIYRFVQDKNLAHTAGPTALYAPLVAGPLPEGVSPAAVLGPIRNFQAKLLSAWSEAVQAGSPPRDIVDLVEAYGKRFPTERAEAVRVFLVTTFGATVKPGGISRAPADATAALAELGKLDEDVVAGRRTLRDALVLPTARPTEPRAAK